MKNCNHKFKSRRRAIIIRTSFSERKVFTESRVCELCGKSEFSSTEVGKSGIDIPPLNLLDNQN